MKRIVISCLCVSNLLFALNNNNADSPLSPKNFSVPELNKNQNRKNDEIQDLKNNQFYLGLDKNKVKEVQQKDKINKHVLDKFDNISINQKPVVKSISSQDAIALHPYFTTTLLLPKGSVVSYATGKMFQDIKHSQNMVTVDIPNDFDRGNLVIVYTLANKNRVLNVMAKRFDKKEIRREVLNTMYSYRLQPDLSDLEVLQAYVKEYRKYPTKKYSYLYVGDITYRIVQDNTYGTVFFKGKKYRVENGIVGK